LLLDGAPTSAGKALLPMPYLFPYENVFILGVGMLIVGLLALRIRVARRRRRPSGGPDKKDT
jgi:hypothetical protein